MIPDPILANHWHAVAYSHEIAEGALKPARLLGEDLVLWRGAGGVRAWRDLCVHRGARLSRGRVSGNELACPYHGWRYAEDGRCVRIPAHPGLTPPARAAVTAYRVEEAVGLVWVCLGTPACRPPEFPEFGDARFRKVACGPYSLHASAPRIVENGLDMAHLAVVHEGLLGDLDHAEIADYEARSSPDGVFAADIRVWQNNVDGTGRAGIASYHLAVIRPFTLTTRKPESGRNFSIFVTVTPLDALNSLYYSWVAMDYDHGVPDATIRGFQDRVFAQDIAVIETQRPELLPLDLQAELHLRSDRASIAYRQWLSRTSVSLGTS